MHFLVTGATGFIGQSVVRAALRNHHRVTALVRSRAKADSLLPIDNKGLEVIECDSIAQYKLLSRYDGLIHLAWEDVGKHTDSQNLLRNLAQQFLMIQGLINKGIRDITVSGTCLEYGLANGSLEESATTNPASFYGLTKLTLYQMLYILQKQQPDLQLKWLRLFYVYGKHQRLQSLYSQLTTAIQRGATAFNMSPGDQRRDFIHVDTLAHNTVAVAQQNEVSGIINVGSGIGTSVIDFVRAVLRANQYQLDLNTGFYPYHAYEPFEFWADVTKLKKVSGAQFDDHIIA